MDNRNNPVLNPTATESPQPGLEFVGVSKRYGRRQDVSAVNDLNLIVRRGEFFSLLGPSGSGKTTTLNLVAGFVDLDTGQIRIDGQPADHLPPEKRDVGVVFQSYALFPHMSIAQNVAFPLKRRHTPDAELTRRVDEVLGMVGLGDRSAARPNELSGGQQQRAALARALVYRPKLVLLDEPLGALDRRLRQHLQEELRLLHANLQFTALYVTHDQEEAFSLSDRIAIMNQGRLVQTGTPEELYSAPNSLFVAKFVGDANIVRGTVVESGHSPVVRTSVGTTLRATTAMRLDEGQACAVIARPEDLALQSEVDTAPRPVFHYGRLVDRTYLAQDVVSLVRTNDGELVRVRARHWDRGDAIAVGDPATIVWHRDDCPVAVPADEVAQ